MSLADVSARTGITRAQISLIENGKVDPRMSTVVKLLNCYRRSFADLDSSSTPVSQLDEVLAQARAGADRLASLGVTPSDPEARLARKESRKLDVQAEREAMATRR